MMLDGTGEKRSLFLHDFAKCSNMPIAVSHSVVNFTCGKKHVGLYAVSLKTRKERKSTVPSLLESRENQQLL